MSNIASGGVRYGLFVKEGDEGWSDASQGDVAGTTGKGWKTDAFRMSGFAFPAEYRIQVGDVTIFERPEWLAWTAANENNWSTGGGRTLHAIEFRFPQGIPADTKILGGVHVQTNGWMPSVTIQNGTILGTTGQTLRLEAIQIAGGSGPEADEQYLRQALATGLDVHKKGVITREMANNGKAYRIPSYEEVLVEKLVAFPAGNQAITIACGGPNPVYYHTEGNPPKFGENDNGDIEPGHISTFKITSVVRAVKVYLHAKHGHTDCAVFFGPVTLSGFDPSSPEKIRDFIKKRF